MPILGLEKEQFLTRQKVAMGAHRKKAEPPQFLSGWKEIASYLGKGVRTVQRYESELALPVRRPAGKTTGSVVATKAELDGWVKASPIRSCFLLPPRVDDISQGTTDAIRQNLAEMARLKAQMVELRAEVRATLGLLHHSLEGLRGTMGAVLFGDQTAPTSAPPGRETRIRLRYGIAGVGSAAQG